MTDFSIPHLLYEEDSFGIFLLVSVAMGGGAAWLAGRAIAATWRPLWHVVAYTFVLGAAVRFFHFALFGGTLLSPHYYLIDTALCLICGLAAYRVTRARQMVVQYGFRNTRTGPFSWARRSAASAEEPQDSG